jgi:hypothetical protein
LRISVHIDPDPKSITTEEYLSEVDASSAADDFDERISWELMEHSMRTSEKKDNYSPSEEEENNPFGEEDNLKLTQGNPILDDILPHINDSRSHHDVKNSMGSLLRPGE